MDHTTLHQVNVAASRHHDDATRAVFMRGLTAGIGITVDAVAEGRATPEWVEGVRLMVALEEEFRA